MTKELRSFLKAQGVYDEFIKECVRERVNYTVHSPSGGFMWDESEAGASYWFDLNEIFTKGVF